ncbi:probable nucleoporin Nup54 [Chrysoperla carnea]|uniref:probable nucleoporin Nup54 n=1 Tax=Chrysoperla carnea TaxID=189513 RepID=UPI001D083F5E|nr:probable nucleoporin Nup54 [Chrysoperla carnea]
MAFNFGSSQTQPGLNFGANTQQNKPAFGATGSTGFSFGQSTQQQTPSFGFGATTATTSAAPNFGFGSNFGAPASTATSGFGSLGAPTSTSTGFGGFGTTATSTPGTGFSFGGTPATTATSGFNFGGTATTTASTGFGGFGGLSTQGTQQQSTGLFSGFGTTTPATQSGSLFGGLGTTTNTGSTFGGGLGTSFGQKPGTSFSFGSTLGGGTSTLGGGFGAGTTFGSTLGQPQQQQQQQPSPDPNQTLINAVLNVRIFGDERDTIIAKWNLLQASWGVGKGYYSTNQPPVEFTPENPFCRFQAIAYSAMPGKDNKDGEVVMVFNKKENDVKAQLSQIQQQITQQVLGNKPELKITVDEIKALNENTTQVCLYVEEKNNLGTIRKIPANEFANFLNQNMQKQMLTNIGVIKLFANVKPDAEQIQEYLKSPPNGIDPRIWKQAQEDNPNSTKYIPVPIIGFNNLKWRLQTQENETALHRAYLNQVTDDIAQLKQKQAASIAQITEYKRKFSDLQHRVLKILVKQEMYRKVGMALQPEEEHLRIQLENMQAQISVPTQFRGRLTELLAHIRILRCGDEPITGTGAQERYTISPLVQEDIKQFLSLEHIGINHLIETIHKDQHTLNEIKKEMLNILQQSS